MHWYSVDTYVYLGLSDNIAYSGKYWQAYIADLP